MIPSHINSITIGGSLIEPHIQSNQINLSMLTKLSITARFDDNYESLNDLTAAIGNIRCVELIGFRLLTDISLLGAGNKHVILSGCCLLIDFTPLKHVRKVEMRNCDAFTNASQLSHVYDLTIDSCPNLVSLKGLSDVHQLTLQCAYKPDCNLRSLKGCENIPYIDARHLRFLNPEARSFKYFINNQKVIVPADWVDEEMNGIERMSEHFLPPFLISDPSRNAYAFVRK